MIDECSHDPKHLPRGDDGVEHDGLMGPARNVAHPTSGYVSARLIDGSNACIWKEVGRGHDWKCCGWLHDDHKVADFGSEYRYPTVRRCPRCDVVNPLSVDHGG